MPVPSVERDRFATAGTTDFPDLADLFAFRDEPWREQAACRDEPDEELFVQDPGRVFSDPRLGSASLLLPLLLCDRCPVRRECLRAALEPPVYTRREDDHTTAGEQVTPRVFGTWGGTHEMDRLRLRHLPVDDAIEELERTFPQRLEERKAAWKQAVATRRVLHDRDRRVAAMLGFDVSAKQRTSKRLTALPAGPGRGHRGPIAIYAAAHGVSRSTAWRRLKAS